MSAGAAAGEGLRIHFIGIGGTGMGALAGLLKACGHEVRGSDGPIYPPMSTQLARAGIPVFEGFAADNLAWDPERVVVGNVCKADHPEVVEAQRRGIGLESFPSMLAKTLLATRRSLVVAGTHGKTTTASLLTWMLRAAGRDPSWLIGGVPQNLARGSHLGGGEAIVLEGDEYDTAYFDKKSKFLHYRPQRAIITSVEYDHADIFDSFEQVQQAFAEFVELIPDDGLLVVDASNPGAMAVAEQARCPIATYQVLQRRKDPPELATYACRITSRSSVRRTHFELFERGTSLGEFSTLLTGGYNLGNIMAAFAVARAEGCEVEALRRAIALFRGVKRRQELVGMAQGVRVIQDFAHHPTAVDLTIKAIRRRFPDNSLHVCFEPRSSSSRRDVFFQGYVQAFDGASRTYVGPVFAPDKVPAGKLLDVAALAQAIRERGLEASHFDSIPALAESVIEHAAPGDTVLLLSSGAFGGLADRLLESFGDAVTFAQPEDVAAIDQLLTASGMPPLVDPEEIESLVIRPSRERKDAAERSARALASIIGCVHLQLVDERAFLFGLAVAPGCRGEGLGWVLADSIMRRARTLGARSVHLLAGETADFFTDKLGFRPVALEDLHPAIRELSNFVVSYREGSVCMSLEFPDEG